MADSLSAIRDSMAVSILTASKAPSSATDKASWKFAGNGSGMDFVAAAMPGPMPISIS
ncbi:hypothetical protein NKH47_19900 [Mesorhizobium sp. M1060]|uniref:hypothetical protein n=1 Tax=Mesorhizobium sp. M1060 TaxID=2957052 RepID=UPI00333796E9